MKNINLKTYQCTEFNFHNKLPANTKIELANKYSYNCGYSKNNICRGEFRIEISDKENSERFAVTAVVIGIFDCADGMPKEKLHVASFRELFPFVKALIATMTTAAGMPPVLIPAIDIESQQIYKVEMPNFHKPENETEA